MYSQLHFSKFVEGLIFNLDNKNNNILFIKQFNDNAGVEQEIRKSFESVKNTEVLCFQYDNSELQEAYEPFLDWINLIYVKYFSDKFTPEKFIDKCDVYFAQREIFIEYLKTGKATRKHEMLINEISYEIHRMVRSIINIFDFISKTINVVFVLNRFHFANTSTIDLITEFIDNYDFCRIALMCIYDDSYKKNAIIEEKWKSLNLLIEDNNYLMAWDDRTLNDSVSIIRKEFTPKASNIENYIKKLKNMIKFLTFSQASIYVDTIFQKVNMEHLNLSDEQEYQLMCIYIYVKICTGEVNSAIHMCSTLSDTFKLDEDLYKNFEYCYLSTLAYVYSAKTKEAEKYSKRCMNIAQKMNDERYTLRAYVARCYVDFYGWKYVLGEIDTDFPVEIIKVFEQKGMLNLAGTIYAYAYKCDEEYDVEKSKIKLVAPRFIEKAIEIAKKIDDEILLSAAYMNKANVCASVNNFDYVDSIYRECIRIYKKYNETVLMAQIYISVGYNLLMVEQYVHSNEYFNEALEILYQEKDIERIGETLYNMGLNCMLAMDYDDASKFLLTSYKICQVLELNGYAVCKLSKIFGLIAICSYYLKKDYMVTYYVNKAEKILKHFLDGSGADDTYWEEDLFLYYFGKGLIYSHECEYEQALDCFDKAKMYADRCLYFTYFSYPYLSSERAYIYNKLNKKKLADKSIDEAVQVMEKYNLTEKKRILIGIKNGLTYSCSDRMGLTNLTIKQIIDMAYYRREINQYNSENKDIDFLFSWQSILNLFDNNANDLFEKNMLSIKNSFALDGIYCFTVSNGIVNNIYTSADIAISEDKFGVISNAIFNDTPAFIANRTEGILKEQKDIIDCFGHNNLVTIIGVPYRGGNNIDYYLLGYANIHSNFANNKIMVNTKVLQVVKIVFGQFIDAIERIKSDEEIKVANNKLKDMATKDMLTSLYNRQGYVSRIKELIESGANNATIMYFDLDNFKYYNDTYGHDMGDMILTEFSRILFKCQSDGDFAVRYGGDEFLLILADKDVEYSKNIAGSIYKILDDDMAKRIEEKAGKKIDISDQLKLTCSIGIAAVDLKVNDGVTEALRQADKALYMVKNSGKGKYMIGE